MAGKGSQGGGSPRSSMDNASRPSMERKSTDSKPADATEASAADTPATEPEKDATTTATTEDETNATEPAELAIENKPQTETISDEAMNTAAPEAESVTETAVEENEPAPAAAAEEETTVSSKEIEQLKASHQQEVQEYVERIDSIESKLQYLAKSAAESAKKTANAAPSGSMESKLAGKDEKIALLMEEGQKLAAGEQKYRTIIKKLRQQLADSEKQKEEHQKGRDKATADADALRKKLNGSEEKEKHQEEMRKATAGFQKELDGLKKDKTTRDETVRKLERDLKAKTEEANKAATLSKNLASEREKMKTQEESYATLRAEKEALADKSKQEGIEWSEKLDRAIERGRSAENELKVEMKAMETKLEIMRTQAEEATSGSGGEAQVKLLRQIETLQSQYASASSNWQSMESSLLAKLSNLEKERDEAQKRESDMRKKARDSVRLEKFAAREYANQTFRRRELELWTRSCKMSNPR